MNNAEFRANYDRVYEEVKPLNYILDGLIIAILTPTFLLLIPLVISSFRTKWNKLKVDMKIAILIVYFDLLSAIDAMMNHFFNLIHLPWNFPNQLACTINSSFAFFVFFSSITLVGVLSLERYMLVVCKKHYSDKFYYIIIVLLSLFNILICLVSGTTGGFGLVPIGTYCLFDVSKPGGIAGSLLAGGLVGTALFVTFFAYIKICLFRSEQSKKAQIELGLDPVKVQKEVNSIILKSLSIIMASTLANGPYTLILFLQIASSAFQTPAMFVVGTILINLNITLNSLILINMKPELLKDIKKMYGLGS